MTISRIPIRFEGEPAARVPVSQGDALIQLVYDKPDQWRADASCFETRDGRFRLMMNGKPCSSTFSRVRVVFERGEAAEFKQAWRHWLRWEVCGVMAERPAAPAPVVKPRRFARLRWWLRFLRALRWF